MASREAVEREPPEGFLVLIEPLQLPYQGEFETNGFGSRLGGGGTKGISPSSQSGARRLLGPEGRTSEEGGY